MRIKSPKLREVEFSDKEVLDFPEGLYGFEHLKRFILIEGGKKSLFSYLQSIDDENVTFIIANPAEIIKGYSIDIEQSEYDSLQIKDKEMLADFVIVTIPENIEDISVNLLGP